MDGFFVSRFEFSCMIVNFIILWSKILRDVTIIISIPAYPSKDFIFDVDVRKPSNNFIVAVTKFFPLRAIFAEFPHRNVSKGTHMANFLM